MFNNKIPLPKTPYKNKKPLLQWSFSNITTAKRPLSSGLLQLLLAEQIIAFHIFIIRAPLNSSIHDYHFNRKFIDFTTQTV